MFVITEIESKILQLEGGAFQELCDAFLFKKGYKNITQYGKQAGTMKTAKGTPDTYFINQNEKYVLVQYTTEQGKIFNKIKEDIEKCFDSNKIKVNKESIEEIIYCHTSSRININKDKELKDLCIQHNVTLSIYGINMIAKEIYLNYPILAKDFFGISLDTNQIMESDDFIKEYDSNKMLAPISTKFLFREKEIKELTEALENKDIVVISGQAGVGKTRLALEVAKSFEKRYNYKLLCIKSKKLEIFEDTKRYIHKDQKYILFIDDGNELKQIELILDLLNEKNLKIIITVRNYVKDIVNKNIKKFTDKIYEKELETFTDKEITEFLKENLGIFNSRYIEQILKISSGNPRIAYMAGKVAVEKNNIEVIHNVERLYEAYYSIMPIKLNEKLCIVGSMISIFGAINLKSDFFRGFVKICNLTEEELWDNIKKLEELEYIEIKYENTVRILDQCFANYLLYKSFIKDKFINLNLIIEYGFEYFRESLIRMIQMFSNLFFSNEVLEYIKNEVNITWNRYRSENNYLLEDFIKVFYSLNEIEALSYIYEKIENLEKKEINVYNLKFDKDVTITNSLLKMFPNNKQTDELENVIELLFQYLLKRNDLIEEGHKLILENYGINRYSLSEDYKTQIILFNKFSSYINLKEIRVLFYKIAEHFLQIGFMEFESNKRALTLRKVGLLNSENLKVYRNKIWTLLLEGFNFKEKNYIFDILKSLNYYFEGKEYKEIFEIDKPYIIKLLQELIFFDEIRVVKSYFDLKQRCQFYDIKIEDFLLNIKPQIYITLSGKRILYRKNFDYELKSTIKDFSNTITLKEVFEKIFEFSLEEKKEITVGLKYFIENFYTSKEKLKEIFSYCNILNIEFYFYPETLLMNMFEKIGIEETYKIINDESLEKDIKNNWRFLFFELLPENKINTFYKDELLKFIRDDNQISYCRNIRFLKKYYLIEKSIYVLIAQILYNKNNLNILKNYYSGFLFNPYCNSPKEVLEFYEEDLELLKNIYFLLEREDYTGEFFCVFLDYDFDYLIRYLELLKNGSFWEDNKLKNCWNKKNYIEIFDYIFEYLSECYYSINLYSIFLRDNSNVKKWFIHIIDKFFDNEKKILFLFEIISQLDENIKLECILYFINKNRNIEIFKNISLEPRFKSWTGSEIPLLSKEVEFYEKLLSNITDLKFIRHKNYLSERIRDKKTEIKKVEKREYLEKYS